MRTPAIALLLAACAAAADGATAVFRTLGGAEVAPLQVPPGRIHVLLFVSHDCPIANSYAPAIADLHRELRGSEVDMFLVHVDPDLTAAAAARHAGDYGLQLPIVLDPYQQLAAAVGATKTPEAAVLTAAGLQYRGRIDDRWRGFGLDGQQAEHRDLELAIVALRAGGPIAASRTEVVGCWLPEPRH